MTIDVRYAREDDLPRLTEIYNHYVAHSAATFDLVPFMVEERKVWMDQYHEHGPYRLMVATEEGRVVGYATSSRFRDKRAYDTTVETTVYVEAGCEARGIGSSLYSALFEALAAEDLHRAYAGITRPNAASVALHCRFGFEPAGTLREVGRKLGRYWDVEWFEKALPHR